MEIAARVRMDASSDAGSAHVRVLARSSVGL